MAPLRSRSNSYRFPRHDVTGPEVSPLLARIGGDRFRNDLKKRLEELADETDDPAYASRLRLVARGERPLRTLLHDPQWTQQFQQPVDDSVLLKDLPEAQREALDERVSAMRDRMSEVFAGPEQAKSDALDIARIADRAHAALQQESLSGWSYVHEVDREADKPGEGSRDL